MPVRVLGGSTGLSRLLDAWMRGGDGSSRFHEGPMDLPCYGEESG